MQKRDGRVHREPIAQAIVQTLEQRVLLSAAIEDGVLKLVGTEGADTIVVSVDKNNAAKLSVNDNGSISSFETAQVQQIMVCGRAGDDEIRIDEADGPIALPAKLMGGKGEDSLTGGCGDDMLHGGKGADSLEGASGDDRMMGGRGADKLDGGEGNDELDGGTGRNLLAGRKGRNRLGAHLKQNEKGGKDDQVPPPAEGEEPPPTDGAGSVLRIDGTDEADTIAIGVDEDGNLKVTFNGQISTVLVADIGRLLIYTGNGDDRIEIDAAVNLPATLYGENGNDTLIGGAADDEIYGGNGEDVLGGGAGNDELYGENGKDNLAGDAGKDSLYGGNGKDVLTGGDDDDELDGGNGKDTIEAGSDASDRNKHRGRDRDQDGDDDDEEDDDDDHENEKDD